MAVRRRCARNMRCGVHKIAIRHPGAFTMYCVDKTQHIEGVADTTSCTTGPASCGEAGKVGSMRCRPARQEGSPRRSGRDKTVWLTAAGDSCAETPPRAGLIQVFRGTKAVCGALNGVGGPACWEPRLSKSVILCIFAPRNAERCGLATSECPKWRGSDSEEEEARREMQRSRAALRCGW